MESSKKKGISTLGIVLVIILGIAIGRNMIQTDTASVASSAPAPSKIREDPNKPPFFTNTSLEEQMTEGFRQTSWYKYIGSYLVTDNNKTIRVLLKTNKKNISSTQVKSIAGAVAGLTYVHGRTNYFIYEVVDNENKLLYKLDLVDENAKNMMATLKKVIQQSKGAILKFEPKDENWDGMNIVVSDSWYYAKDFEKERFVEAYGNQVNTIILKYMNILGKDNISIYFVDQFGKEVASPKVFGGYKIKN